MKKSSISAITKALSTVQNVIDVIESPFGINPNIPEGLHAALIDHRSELLDILVDEAHRLKIENSNQSTPSDSSDSWTELMEYNEEQFNKESF